MKINTGGSREWERFPNNLNRKYYTRYQSVTLRGKWNDFEGREIIHKKFHSSENLLPCELNPYYIELALLKYKRLLSKK